MLLASSRAKESLVGLSLIKAHICVAIAVLDIDNHVTDDIYARSVAEELLVCRFCIILLCFKELMVEINIVGFHLIQFTSGNQGFFISKALSLSAVLKS